jgi:hypothetical protein
MDCAEPPLMRCLRSGGRMFSSILFSCSLAAWLGPWLLITLEAEEFIGYRIIIKPSFFKKLTFQSELGKAFNF